MQEHSLQRFPAAGWTGLASDGGGALWPGGLKTLAAVPDLSRLAGRGEHKAQAAGAAAAEGCFGSIGDWPLALVTRRGLKKTTSRTSEDPEAVSEWKGVNELSSGDHSPLLSAATGSSFLRCTGGHGKPEKPDEVGVGLGDPGK